ncbi:tyrosine-protein phosphatase [Streptomyces cocklensis]|uniref:Protein tyrosine phosphatase n=1 Tax=Actinacidiphila cocklensis TaxID=887465 RepID=A0A9W4GX54_9ACTN|nr:tyrosine-protein phosphatase [Actinacidiphila cocklensis]MDD1057708.1 tyrosine-protein phosphatase [Actinacidiphila cocklensis]WSX78786.1 tyrosine-protein phosphatase [Streptomyces sp. NBC_00899]CAG6398410.1 Protein tyrosine phosphatase [Actinacidiphila cocklensis]
MGTVVLAVDVVRDGTGGLGVSWELSGAGPVELSVGPTPESVGRGGPVARVDGATRTSLAGLGPGRHYVSVAPVGGGGALLAAERVMPLEGASNFRDLGGYRVRGGGRTRWGMVFRADAPDRLTAADLAAIGQLGLRVAYDLRTDDERSTAPSALPAAVRSELLAIGGDAARTSPLGELFRSGRAGAVPDDFLQRVYLDMAEQDAPALGRVLTGLAAPDGVPAVIHCTAGKDRTGLAAALLLSVLGADDATVLDDYALSRIYFSERRMARLLPRLAELGLDQERYHAVFGAPRHAMATTLDTLRERYGSLEAYLTGPGGVTPGTLAALRARLVAPAADA